MILPVDFRGLSLEARGFRCPNLGQTMCAEHTYGGDITMLWVTSDET